MSVRKVSLREELRQNPLPPAVTVGICTKASRTVIYVARGE